MSQHGGSVLKICSLYHINSVFNQFVMTYILYFLDSCCIAHAEFNGLMINSGIMQLVLRIEVWQLRSFDLL